jgi:hypothetical protein
MVCLTRKFDEIVLFRICVRNLLVLTESPCFLAHSDEIFTNPSLGNCMDYTDHPEENLHPDESNYRRLVSVYGEVGRRRRGLFSEQSNVGRNRRVLTEDLRQEYEEAVAEIEDLSVRRALSEMGISEGTAWELTHHHPRGSTYERPLGKDYFIQAQLLHKFDHMD